MTWLKANGIKLFSAAVLTVAVWNGIYRWVDVQGVTATIALLSGFGLLVHSTPQTWTKHK
jgi:hypothetical protein